MLSHLSRTYPSMWIHQIFAPPSFIEDEFRESAVIQGWRDCRRWAKTHGFEMKLFLQSRGRADKVKAKRVDFDDEQHIPPPFTTMAIRLRGLPRLTSAKMKRLEEYE